MDEPPRKLNPLERFSLAWLDPDPDYAAWWRKYELEGWLKGVSLFGFIAICILGLVHLLHR
ncbi:hypothetical protein [Mesorhizobium huakuii]|uniref:Uncharacterized protein n=1 Tax=Mesorhizobium huakuii TaxID=28104 RepID=A0ABZ0VQN9_9HYPH|nr:hypothetical protein [Mesorhizobium huakuii]WQB99193.1 hypothetical protein U0R22_003366 [Mesorhizobium huakuii]